MQGLYVALTPVMIKVNTFKVIGEWPHVASVDFSGASASASVLSVWFVCECGILPALLHLGLETTKHKFL